jgi:hypothetical protein
MEDHKYTLLLPEVHGRRALDEWNSRPDNPPSQQDLIVATGYINPDGTLPDGRSKFGRELKLFMASQKIKPKGAHQHRIKGPVDLTEENKLYLQSNRKLMTGFEMTKIIFGGHITPLSRETLTVNEYLAGTTEEGEQRESQSDNNSEIRLPGQLSEYKPPKSFDKALAKVNKYFSLKPFDKSKMLSREKKNVETLMKYLNTYRFVHQMNTYSSQIDRELFESSFVRYTHDKPDLTEEEVDQYIVMCIEVCIASNIQTRVERLQNMLDDTADDTEGRRISMGLVEAISSRQQEYNQCVNRQQKLLESLKEKRSARLSKQVKENASIVNLVQLWKEEESRKKLLALAELRKKAVKQETEKLSSMDEIKARILGLSEEEVLDG